jgi:hypothetical protein
LIFVIVKCGVSFAVRTEFLNIILMIFGFKGLMWTRLATNILRSLNGCIEAFRMVKMEVNSAVEARLGRRASCRTASHLGQWYVALKTFLLLASGRLA